MALIVGCVSAVRIPLDTQRFGFWPLGAFVLVHALAAFGVTIWVWRRGARWPVRASDLAYVAVMLPHLVTFWLAQMFDHGTGTLVEPLMPHHTTFIAIALLPPSNVRWGMALVATFAAHGVALWATLVDTAAPSVLGREPWSTLIVGGIAIGILWSRGRRRDLELRLVVVEARADVLDRLNRVLLALRDRANTPLQTLEVAISLIEAHPLAEDRVVRATLAAMRRALAQLVSAQQPLSGAVVPDRAAQLAVDLERELRELRAAPLKLDAPRE